MQCWKAVYSGFSACGHRCPKSLSPVRKLHLIWNRKEIALKRNKPTTLYSQQNTLPASALQIWDTVSTKQTGKKFQMLLQLIFFSETTQHKLGGNKCNED